MRPKLHTMKYPVPNDEFIPLAYPVVINLLSKKVIRLDIPPLNSTISSPLENDNKRLWWSDDGNQVEALWQDRCFSELTFFSANSATGNSKILVSEESDSFITPNIFFFFDPNVKRLSTGEIIWFSEKSGYGHLYLYNKNNQQRRAITSGDYLVRDILHIDEKDRLIYFTGNGKNNDIDPYFINLYKINFDGSGLTLLTPGNADHKVTLSPNQQYFISNNAWNGAPNAELRDISGSLIMPLENSDFSAWTDKGWEFPERIQLMAVDDKTKIYATLFKPTHVAPGEKYPVLDDIYPGPQINRAYYIGFNWPIVGSLRHQIATAELGFVVVNLDGRGTPFRSKGFHNYSYNDIGFAGGLVDHIAGIKQLYDRYDYIDRNKVGIFGHSAGGYASTRALLEFPEFYDVAVSSAGNHDSRANTSIWLDLYMCMQSTEAYEDQSNLSMVSNLKGKLMLMTGDLDDNVHPTATYNLIDALIKEHKDFDFLLIPNASHSDSKSKYFEKKRWDYFYQHILGKTPPTGFRL